MNDPIDISAELLAGSEAVILPRDSNHAVAKIKLALPGRGQSIADFAHKLGSTMATGNFFIRGGLIVYVTEKQKLSDPVSPQALRTLAARFCDFPEFVKGINGDPVERNSNMTSDNANAVMASSDFLDRFREIARVSEVRLPIIRSNGVLELLPEGYDAEAKVYSFAGVSYAEDMTLEAAHVVLDGLRSEFPWNVDSSGCPGLSRSRCLAAMLAPFLDQNFMGKLRPAFLFSANTEGAGKTLLVKLCLTPVFGETSACTYPDGRGDEMRKLLDAEVLGASPYLLLDNVKGKMNSSALESFLTSTSWKGRILGQSKSFNLKKDCVVYISANDAKPTADLLRRSVRLELFVKTADPASRTIKDFLDEPKILSRRSEILAALWAVCREWDKSGQKTCSGILNGFEDWSRIVGGMVEFFDGKNIFLRDVASTDPIYADFLTWIESLCPSPDSPLRISQTDVRIQWFALGLFPELIAADEGEANPDKEQVRIQAKRASALMSRYDDRIFGNRLFRMDKTSRPRSVVVSVVGTS